MSILIIGFLYWKKQDRITAEKHVPHCSYSSIFCFPNLWNSLHLNEGETIINCHSIFYLFIADPWKCPKKKGVVHDSLSVCQSADIAIIDVQVSWLSEEISSKLPCPVSGDSYNELW
ncbi:hypothetical protein HQ584_11180 [Patescibacteria group bacterium]|nr:hypothetical protein [Patescibacteria group bacterium]